jgi:membrane protein DedA with SNARE-associated domain
LNLAALYVYATIVGWVFITGIGLPPIPEEAAVAGLGVWIHTQPDALLIFSYLFCLGAVLGTDLFLYSIGRLGGPRLMSRPWVQKFLKPERIQTFSHKFQEKGVWFMMTARIIPGWRSAVFMTAGVIKYPVGRFVLADAISSVPLVSFFFFAGYFAADWINTILVNIHQAQNMLLLIAFIGAIIVGIILYVRWMRAKEKQEAVEEAIEHIKMEEAGELPVTKENPLVIHPPAEVAEKSPVMSGAERSIGSQSQ